MASVMISAWFIAIVAFLFGGTYVGKELENYGDGTDSPIDVDYTSIPRKRVGSISIRDRFDVPFYLGTITNTFNSSSTGSSKTSNNNPEWDIFTKDIIGMTNKIA